ncbi:hypothetical protein Tco_1481154 [Tanacetum coccineum]
MGTPTQYLCDYWSGWVRLPNFSAPAGRPFRCVSDIWLLISGDAKIMPPSMRTQSAGQPATESLRGGTGERVGRSGRGRRHREGNDDRVDELNSQGNDQGLGANGGVEGVSGNVEGANGGVLDFSAIIVHQLQNLLSTMLAQVSNRGNVENQNGNVVNENVQENVGNMIVNGNRVGCSYKEYDGKGGVVALTRWIKKMESVHDMSGCSIDQKVKYTAGSFMVHHLVTPESRMIERYVYGIAPQIRRMVAATEPNIIQKAV